MRHGSLFSGIGGFDLAAEWMGWENVFHCEIIGWNRKLLRRRFKYSIEHEDIRTTDFNVYKGRIDIITGGFPCQNISRAASKHRDGADGNKSGLWREMLRACYEIRPRYILIENSTDLLRHGFNKLLYEFSKIGYDAEWQCLQGNQFGTPQRRKRLFALLYTSCIGNRLQEKQIFSGWNKPKYTTWGNAEDRIYRVANGISHRVDRHRAIGNAIIPLIVYEIFKAIEDND